MGQQTTLNSISARTRENQISIIPRSLRRYLKKQSVMIYCSFMRIPDVIQRPWYLVSERSQVYKERVPKSTVISKTLIKRTFVKTWGLQFDGNPSDSKFCLQAAILFFTSFAETFLCLANVLFLICCSVLQLL